MLGILLVSIIDFILLVVVAATTLPECNELRGTQIVAQVSARIAKFCEWVSLFPIPSYECYCYMEWLDISYLLG
jgi:hypothetical protein